VADTGMPVGVYTWKYVATALVCNCASYSHVYSRLKGGFSVTRVWPACVVPAENNFIFVSIVKRDARGMRGVIPVRGIRMRERAYNFSVYFRVGRSAHSIVLTIVYTVR
jgi:hypothetical protein